MAIALLLLAVAAAIWWLVGHKGWGTLQKVVFWLVVVAVLGVLVALYGLPQPAG
jgi:hypothetical protein